MGVEATDPSGESGVMTPKVRLPSSRFQAVEGFPELEFDSKSGIFYVRKFVAGKGELFKSTKTRKRGLAKTVADQFIAEFITRKPGLRARRIKIEELCPLLLKSLKEETETKDQDGHPLRRPITHEKDRTYLENKTFREKEIIAPIPKYFGDCFADEIDELFWKNWVKKVGRKEGRKLGDIAKYLSMVLEHAFTEKYIGRKPRITNPDSQKNRALVYSGQQIVSFYANAEPLLQDLIIMAAENPLRPHEVREVRWEMLHFGKGADKRPQVVLRIPAWFAKVGESRELVLSQSTRLMLERRRKQGKPGGAFVFPAPRDPRRPVSKKVLGSMWARMKKNACITQDIKFHWLRHSFYTRALLEAREPVQLVSAAGGTSIATLQKKYLKPDAQKTASVSKAVNLNWTGEEE